MMIEGWYISAEAVRQFQALAGIPAADDGPYFDRAAVELERLCEHARYNKSLDKYDQYYVTTTLRGRKTRLELKVNPQPRDEGDAPQLVAVRLRGGRG